MASELRVNSSTNRSGLGTITYTDSGPIVSGVGTFANGLTVNGTQTTVKSLKLTGDNYNANWFKTSSTFRLNDNAKLNIGSADDMQQYHDGTTSYIKNTTGVLRIENTVSNIGLYASHSSGDIIMRAGGATSSENAIVAVSHGEVTLAFNGSTKLTTTNTGAVVSGILTATGRFHADGINLADSKSMILGTSSDMYLYHDGSNGVINNAGAGNLYLFGGNGSIYLRPSTDDEHGLVVSPNAGVELYYNGVRTAYTQQDALTVHGRTSNSGMIEIASNQGANNNDRFRIHKTSAGQRLSIQNYASGSWVENIRITAGNMVELKHADGTTKFQTTSTGVSVINRITAGGDDNTYINVGSSADTLEFFTGGSNVFKFDSSGRIVVNNSSAQDGAAKLQIKGGTAADILTADITDETVAVFGGSSPGTTQTGYGAGIVIKPIISRGSNFFLGACNSGSNQEGNGYFVIRQGHLANNTTERLRINQNGQVEIQERLWVPGSKLISLGNSANSPHFSFYKDDATGVNHITSNSGAEIKCSSGNGDSNGFEFWDYTGNNKRCQIDGHGIKFNTDTAEANALNDYEEGDHTTTVTMSGDTSFSYSSRTLAYTKIGRAVFVTGRINMTGAGGSSFRFTLPFTCGDGNFKYETSNEVQNIRFDDGYTLRIRSNTSYVDLQSDGSDTGIGTGSPHLNVNIFYFTA